MKSLSYVVRPLGPWTDPVTPADQRRSRHTFKAGWADTLALLADEIDRLDGRDVVMQLDVREQDLRKDGGIRGNASVGRFPGVRISFMSAHGPLTYATDAHDLWQHNVRAIALALGALRAVDRYGVSRHGEQYRGWTAIEQRPATMTREQAAGLLLHWAHMPGVDPIVLLSRRIDLAVVYRTAAKNAHPDLTHDDGDTMARLNAARDLLAGGPS